MVPLRRTRDSLHGFFRGTPLAEMGPLRRTLAWPVRVLLWVARWDVYSRVKLHAQALTYDTLLAMVPAIAVTMAMVNSFGGMGPVSARLQALLVNSISGSPELRSAVASHLHDFVVNIQGGGLGALSLCLLIFSVLSLLNHIEFAFNVIFGSNKTRPWLTRVAVYWAAVTLGPILFGASLAARAALQEAGALTYVEHVSPLPHLVLRVLPWLLTWLAFAVTYIVVPVSAVRSAAAVPAAIVAGSLWQGGKLLYGIYARNAFAVHNIYGSLAAVPLFILWVYVSWLVVLFGAQLAFALQHHGTTLHTPVGPAHVAARELALLRVFFAIAEDFHLARPPCARDALPARLALPVHLSEELVAHLCRHGFVQDVQRGERLLPARELSRVSVADLLQSLHRAGTAPPASAEPTAQFFQQLLGEVEAERHRRTGSVDFQELVSRFSSRGSAAPLPPARRRR